MTASINKVATGLSALIREHENVTNNIANCNTAGFKKSVTSFSSELHKILGKNINLLAGEINAQDTVDHSQGQLMPTGRSLDIGLEGKGFLSLETPAGRLYTRNGSMQINILGQLTDMNGYLVSGQNGPITVPQEVAESAIQISQDGIISAGEYQIGRLQIAEFQNPEAELKPVGNGCFKGPRDYQIVPAQETVVRQRYRENSNVQIVEELTNMLTLSRLFEANMNIMRKQSDNSSAMLDVAKS